MIVVDSFIAGTLATVDGVIADFVNTAYVHLVQANAEVITLSFTLYVMLLGYQFINHTHHFNLNEIMRHLIILLCVYGLVMNWSLYHLFVYNIFTNEPESIAQILAGSAGQLHAGGSIVESLDAIYTAICHASGSFFGQIGFSLNSLAFALYGFLVFIIGTLMCVFALMLYIYAKMMMAVSLALGPIFILMLLWQSTRGMFTAWLNKLLTLALIPIVTSAVLVLMLSVINVTLPMINQPVEQMQFYGIAPFLGLSLTTTLILSQVLKICSALGGGISLASVSAGLAIGRTALQKTGAEAAGRAAGRWAVNHARNVKRDHLGIR